MNERTHFFAFLRGVPARILSGALVCFLGLAASVQAQTALIDHVDVFGNDSYEQTGDGNSLSYNGAFLASRLYSVDPNAFAVALFTPGAATPQVMTPQDPTTLIYSTGFYPSQAALNADFPPGTYQYSATGAESADASFQYAGSNYPTSLPYLTGTNYSDLQGMDAHLPFNFTFSPMVVSPQADLGYIFFSVFDNTTSTTAFSASFLDPGTTGVTLPADTLTAGHSYTYELDFSDRNNLPALGTVFGAVVGADIRSDGTFLATPEPASLLLLAPAAVGLLWLGARHRQPAR